MNPQLFEGLKSPEGKRKKIRPGAGNLFKRNGVNALDGDSNQQAIPHELGSKFRLVTENKAIGLEDKLGVRLLALNNLDDMEEMAEGGWAKDGFRTRNPEELKPTLPGQAEQVGRHFLGGEEAAKTNRVLVPSVTPAVGAKEGAADGICRRNPSIIGSGAELMVEALLPFHDQPFCLL